MRSPNARAVLVALLLEANRLVPVSHLMETAWEQNPPATAEHRIRRIVAALRTQVPDLRKIPVTEEPGFRIVVDDGQLDLIAFEKALDAARRCDTADGEAAAPEVALDV
ncbi:hypothetical protein GCM10017557_01830 [Streptomyces aurantiacus]|uniref:OmpR/PhoB-type domain-containing protein n=1 Tax=Streptomyces aurantiacus TaxID=47760 RepID=A0A7G1NUL7_9ACTN|nr:hypothetical protein [Streptomyces aurantiacus]BCL25324.1 hypothetical protein GCM10017557_01830 [Streptomyces aurantiacus]